MDPRRWILFQKGIPLKRTSPEGTPSEGTHSKGTLSKGILFKGTLSNVTLSEGIPSEGNGITPRKTGDPLQGTTGTPSKGPHKSPESVMIAFVYWSVICTHRNLVAGSFAENHQNMFFTCFRVRKWSTRLSGEKVPGVHSLKDIGCPKIVAKRLNTSETALREHCFTLVGSVFVGHPTRTCLQIAQYFY